MSSTERHSSKYFHKKFLILSIIILCVINSAVLREISSLYLDTPIIDTPENNNQRNHDDDKENYNSILPIIPRTSFASLNSFFSNYTGKGGWIDIGALSPSNIVELRRLAKIIKGENHDILCGYPQVNATLGNSTTLTIPEKGEFSEYCFWKNDFVSASALADFGFEKANWMWVAESFQRLAVSHPNALMNDDSCNQLAFLDIGTNVADWLSPIRLLVPNTVPIYGVEGSPATAAIATANLLTASLYNNPLAKYQNNRSCSKLLPFTLESKSKIPAIHQKGGVCFSQPQFFKHEKKYNVGGQYIVDSKEMDQCERLSDIAGVTTLEHAMASLCPKSNSHNMPKVYILKIDIEGSEFNAISSLISTWLSQTPPCYFMMEVWKKNSYMALIQTLLSVVGYDAIWRVRHNEYPYNTPSWMNGLTGTEDEIKKIISSIRDYTELIFGFTDADQCIHNLIKAH